MNIYILAFQPDWIGLKWVGEWPKWEIYTYIVEQFDFPVSRNSLSEILKENSIVFCSEN